MIIDGFAYPKLLNFFEEISAIPRASYKEEKIADYLCGFAKDRGLEYYRDSANNVLINAPATKGYEKTPAWLLQGHTDMVCEKNEGVEHDFDTQGVEIYEENGWIRAKNTTLGADDGVAVAVMLCVLDGGVEEHGPLQCLFTASEEVGLDGVKAFDYGKIYARRMINMDGSDESVIIAGCAGGLRSSLRLDVNKKRTVAKRVVSLRIKGLCGGHSGEDIDKGRANANKLMGRVLNSVYDGGTELVSVCGGSKGNAIPRECEAILAVNEINSLRSRIEQLKRDLSDGMSADDEKFALDVSVISENSEVNVIDRADAEKIIFILNTVANGIFAMNNDVEGLVEWSRNLGVLRCDADGAELVFSSRSSFETRIDASAFELDCYARQLGAKIRHYNRYPGWSYAPESNAREAYIEAYESLCGKRPNVAVIHAGLECGFISQAVPDMDIISCGAIVLDLHSPDEKLNVKSFERFYSVIKMIMERR